MKAVSPFLSFLVLGALTAPLARAQTSAGDRIHLTDERVLTVEIIETSDEGLRIRTEIELSGGRTGSATEAIPWSAIDHIEFAPLPGEAEVLADPAAASPERLGELWLAKLKYLDRPRSNAGEIGLIYAERLAATDSEFSRTRAMELVERIEASDWNTASRPAASQLRLQIMIRQGNLKEAIREAQRMADEAEEPGALLEAKHVLAVAEFDQLRELEKENPRWYLDDEVRPVRDRHYHAALDLSLFPFLFYGSENEAAARGLLHAAEVYRFAEEPDRARICAEDIVRHYPETTLLPKAQSLIQQLPANESP